MPHDLPTASLRALLAKATERPWHEYPNTTRIDNPRGQDIRAASDLNGRIAQNMTAEDMRLIVAAVNALPALLDKIDALEARVQELENHLAEIGNT